MGKNDRSDAGPWEPTVSGTDETDDILMNDSTDAPSAPERRQYDDNGNVLEQELGHTKSPLAHWIAVWVIIAASIAGAFSLILGEWWLAITAIVATVLAVAYAVIASAMIKRSQEEHGGLGPEHKSEIPVSEQQS